MNLKNYFLLFLILLCLLSIFNNGPRYDKLANGNTFTVELELQINSASTTDKYKFAKDSFVFFKKNELTNVNFNNQFFELTTKPQGVHFGITANQMAMGLAEINISQINEPNPTEITYTKWTILYRGEPVEYLNLTEPVIVRPNGSNYKINMLPDTAVIYKKYGFETKIEQIRSTRFILLLAVFALVPLMLTLVFRNFKPKFNVRLLLKKITSDLVTQTKLLIYEFKQNFKSAFIYWAPIFILYPILLLGRFDWSKLVSQYSFRSYWLCLFFGIILLPLTHFIVFILSQSKKLALAATLALMAITALPYHWLGLDKYFFNPTFERFFIDWRAAGLALPKLNWLPTQFSNFLQIPNEIEFFLITLFCGLLLISLGIAFVKKKNLITKNIVRSLFFICTLFLIAIIMQTWLHLSLRSPYTYLPHFEVPQSSNYWYHFYLFDGAKGAVNWDYPVFRESELLFLGPPREIHILKGRIFPMYLSATMGSAFINPYYVWLGLNIMAWALAITAIYFLAKRIFKHNEHTHLIALYSSLLMTCSQGMILYIAQPKPYAIAIGSIAVFVLAYHYLFDPIRFKLKNAFAFGAVLGLLMLTYESQPWLPAILLLAFVLDYSKYGTIIALLFGVLIYYGFINLGLLVGNLHQAQAMTPIDGHPIDNILNHLKQGDLLTLGNLVVNNPIHFAKTMFHAFHFAAPLALLGIFVLPNRKILFLVLVLILPAVLTYGLMDVGESFYTQFPRLVYSAYPAIFMLNAYTINKASQFLKKLGWVRTSSLLPWLWIAFCFIVANIDIFGLPQIYYYWFYMNPGAGL